MSNTFIWSGESVAGEQVVINLRYVISYTYEQETYTGNVVKFTVFMRDGVVHRFEKEEAQRAYDSIVGRR